MNRKRGPLLLSAFPGNLINLDTGMSKSGLSYMYFMSDANLFSSDDNVLICLVELPFKSAAHLFSQPKRDFFSGETWGNPSGYEQVTLEGDYNEYFNLYVEPDKQLEARYILDPSAMVFTLEFCAQYHWEIVDDTLYFVSKDSVANFDLIDEFVRQIRPAVELEPSRVNQATKLPYSFTHGRVLNCPHCQAQLEVGRAWMQCPAGHGFLISGKQMVDERRSDEAIEYAASRVAQEMMKVGFGCPYCNNPMTQIHYQGGPILVDVCTKCPHRWIDGHEIDAIIG